jgi:hypothetical protein
MYVIHDTSLRLTPSCLVPSYPHCVAYQCNMTLVRGFHCILWLLSVFCCTLRSRNSALCVNLLILIFNLKGSSCMHMPVRSEKFKHIYAHTHAYS